MSDTEANHQRRAELARKRDREILSDAEEQEWGELARAWEASYLAAALERNDAIPRCGACHGPYHGGALLPSDCASAPRERS